MMQYRKTTYYSIKLCDNNFLLWIFPYLIYEIPQLIIKACSKYLWLSLYMKVIHLFSQFVYTG